MAISNNNNHHQLLAPAVPHYTPSLPNPGGIASSENWFTCPNQMGMFIPSPTMAQIRLQTSFAPVESRLFDQAAFDHHHQAGLAPSPLPQASLHMTSSYNSSFPPDPPAWHDFSSYPQQFDLNDNHHAMIKQDDTNFIFTDLDPNNNFLINTHVKPDFYNPLANDDDKAKGVGSGLIEFEATADEDQFDLTCFSPEGDIDYYNSEPNSFNHINYIESLMASFASANQSGSSSSSSSSSFPPPPGCPAPFFVPQQNWNHHP